MLSTNARKNLISSLSIGAGSTRTQSTESFADASVDSGFWYEHDSVDGVHIESGEDDEESSDDESTIIDSLCDDDDDDDDDDNASEVDHTESSGSCVLRFDNVSHSHHCDFEEIRLEKALAWYRRWARPSYGKMRHYVQTIPGLDITLDDVDFLPWSTTSATYRNW